MNLRDRPLHGVAVYNPGLLSKDELIRLFVAREPLLERLLDDLRRETGGTPQHHLIVGRRGMGKTTLLRRLGYAVEDDPGLSATWMALDFPEEQYNVSRPSDFWLNCIDALGDALEDRGRSDRVARIDARVAEIHDIVDERPRHDAALALLGALADELERRLILLVDNVDLILQRFESAEAWALREVLSTRPEILMIGATASPYEAVHEYGAPFYDFFRVHPLGGLGEPETFDVLRRLAKVCDAPAVAKLLDDDPARIKTLRLLAGGNPRTIVLLFSLLAQGVEGSVRTDLERLLDHCTPLYKDRFERLSPQQQTIVDALAIHWDPMHAGALAKRARLPVQAVSSQLSRLEKDGVVEKVPIHPSRKAGFQMAERFFNIWYLMRASRRVRRRLVWLVEFLRLFFGAEQLRTLGRRQLGGPPLDEREHHAEYALALAGVLDEAPLRRALELDGIRTLVEDDGLRRKMAEWFDFEGDDAELKPLVERLRLLDEAKRAIMRADVSGLDVSREELWDLIGGSLSLSVEIKRAIAIGCAVLGWKPFHKFVTHLHKGLERIRPLFGPEFEPLREALRRGDMAGLADVEGARAVAERTGRRGLIAVALGHADLSTSEAFEALALALEGCEAALPWLMLGRAQRTSGDYPASAQTLRRAVELAPDWGPPRCELGLTLQAQPGSLNEAEAVFREAIARKPSDVWAWIALAAMLGRQPGRFDEAEATLRAARSQLGHQPTLSGTLAAFLHARCRSTDEAEGLAREALTAAPADQFVALLVAPVLLTSSGWLAATEPARRFVAGDDAFHAAMWPDIVHFFTIAARLGHAADARALLAESDIGERWRPLAEALRAVEEGTRAVLTQVAPEIRHPAEALLDRFGIDLPG